MGITYLPVEVANPTDSKRSAMIECLVDTGAIYSVVEGKILRNLGIKHDDKITLSLADGNKVVRRTGEALFKVKNKRRVSTVIFGENDDSNLLGVVTLEVMGLFLDPLARKLKPIKVIM